MSVVVLLPGCDLVAGVGQCREQHLVQEFVSEAPVEALDEPVLHGLSRRDVVPLDRRALAPGQDRGRGELCPVVTDDGPRAPPSGDDRVQFTHDPRARQGTAIASLSVSLRGRTLPKSGGGSGAQVNLPPEVTHTKPALGIPPDSSQTQKALTAKNFL
jgi:hypothetical protein